MTQPLSHAEIDAWADDPRGPVALHLKQKLLPIEGEGGVIFPPTYADIDYNIDELADGTKVVTIDSVGAQANRMEPIFKTAPAGRPENPLSRLVPQIDIPYGNAKSVSILEASHRLGDAIVRASDLKDAARAAFDLYLDNNDASAIAQLAPTSLVFGVWDSRTTNAKLPRIVQSIIRAWDVDRLHRSAQYNPPIDYAALAIFSDEKTQAKHTKADLSERGFVHVPAGKLPGGIVARGPIERDVTVNLIALRRLDGEKGRELRRYILGLALVAAAEPPEAFLRQGCLLTPDPDHPGAWTAVGRDGRRIPVALTAAAALDYAAAAARAFGVGRNRTVEFRKALAQEDLAEGDKKKAGKKAKAG